jgi:hypothetical protein
VGILVRYRALRWLPALLVVAALAVAPFGARTPAELLAAGIVNLLVFAALALLVRFFLRNNPLAWVWSCWLALGLAGALALAGMSAPLYRSSGYIALAFVLAPGLVLILDAIAGMRRGEGVAAAR